MKIKKPLYGVGVNDADYETTVWSDDYREVIFRCHFYTTWANMITRCYSWKCLSKHPSYIGCEVHHDWRSFMNFKAWMQKQDWQGNELDKDLLQHGNKIYSDENCCFVSRLTNVFVIDRKSDRGEWPLGVYLELSSGRYKSQCNNPFTKKRENLGRYDCPNKAHLAWKKRKHELACQLAGLQTDERVANALLNRYL